MKEKGFAHIFLLLIILVGLVVGVYLVVTQRTNIFSKASNPPIVFKSLDGSVLTENAQGIPVATSATVQVELTSTLGAPLASDSAQIGTAFYKVAENPADLNQAGNVAYTQEPMVFNYTFQDTNPGTKFLWVEFIDATSQTDRRSAKIEISQASAQAGGCSQYERQWGDWCVYTYDDDKPDKIIWGFDNIYHPNAWFRDGKWNVVAGGWHSGQGQGWQDRVFRFQTSDKYGITGWEIVKGYSGEDFYIDNKFENAKSMDYDLSITKDRDGKPLTPYVAYHAVQPSFFPFENYPPAPDGTRFNCCDTIFYAYDYVGALPEKNVGIHYAFVTSDGVLHKAGEYGDKNPLLDWRTYDNATPRVGSVSDGNVVYDPKTKQFYMVYGEWLADGKLTKSGGAAVTSIAVSGWTNLRFQVVARDLLDGVYAGNPQILVGPDNKYYLFYTRFEGGIFVATADNITGPYSNNKQVLTTNSEYPIAGTPFVFCNKELNIWQMYFYASPKDNVYDNQIYTAFMNKSCGLPPI